MLKNQSLKVFFTLKSGAEVKADVKHVKRKRKAHDGDHPGISNT
jgi:hypothetical protein